VIDDCKSVFLSIAGKEHRATVVAEDTHNDLALLPVQVPTSSPVVFRRLGRAALGESVTVAGYPLSGLLSSDLNVTTGTISAIAGPDEDARLLQITAPMLTSNPACTSDPDTGAGNVVYIYEGADIVPDDIDGIDPDPVTTANVRLNADTGNYEYMAAFLSPGEYTAAFTCQGQDDTIPDEENPGLDVDDAIAFTKLTTLPLGVSSPEMLVFTALPSGVATNNSFCRSRVDRLNKRAGAVRQSAKTARHIYA